MKGKKFAAIVVCFSMILGIASCGKGSAESEVESEEETLVSEEDTSKETEEETVETVESEETEASEESIVETEAEVSSHLCVTDAEALAMGFSYDLTDPITITGYGGDASDVIIPAEIDGIEVVGIGPEVFQGHGEIESVEFPDTLQSIGEHAFGGCYGLTTVDLPDSISTIGESAFNSCITLTTVTLPKNLTTIERKLFYGCSSLNHIVMPENLETIEEYAFTDCSELTTVNLPEKIAVISSYCFRGSGLTEIYIPNSCQAIGNRAFDCCSNLQSISIPKSVVIMGAEESIAPEMNAMYDNISYDGSRVVLGGDLDVCEYGYLVSLKDWVDKYNSGEVTTKTFGSSSEFKDYVYSIDRIIIDDDELSLCVWGLGGTGLDVASPELDGRWILEYSFGPQTYTYHDWAENSYSVETEAKIFLQMYLEVFVGCPDNLVIYCDSGSVAEEYAMLYGITTRPIE